MAEKEEVSSYALRLGGQLRAIRLRRGLTLKAVQDMSNGDFKVSALGNYERGDRPISVARLQRLAQLYCVPVDWLLPRDSSDASA